MIALVALHLGCGEGEAVPVSPYEMPDRSGYTLTTVTDYGLDGVPEETLVVAYGPEEVVLAYDLQTEDYVYAWEAAYDAEGCQTWTSVVLTWEDGDAEGEDWTVACQGGRPVYIEVRTWSLDYEYFRHAEVTDVLDEGLVVLRSRVWYDSDYGEVDWVERYAWSWESGLMTIEDKYTGTTLVEHGAWHRDDVGRVQVYEWISYQDGDFSRDEWEYDAHGRPIVYENYNDPALARTWRKVTTEWDDAIYSPTYEEVDDYGDGVLDEAWGYDCSDTWPWECSVMIDVAWLGEGGEIDGVVDVGLVETWLEG